MRIRRLDGVRGIAAAVVVLHHALLAQPRLAKPYFFLAQKPDWSRWPAYLVYTPLHLAWAGSEAVYVFFVLSGLVLSLSVRDHDGWAGYYLRRFVRIYGPVAAVVVMATYVLFVVRRDFVPGRDGIWLALKPDSVSAGGVLRDLTLVHAPGVSDAPLWSLGWEVIFSLLLPAYLVVTRRVRRHPLLAAALLGAIIEWGFHTGRVGLIYLPLFALGVLLAESDLVPRIARRPWLVRGGVLLMGSWWYARAIDANLASWARGLTAVGALLIVGGIAGGASGAWLEHPAVAWLGSRSFSLYLVHEPILTAADALTAPAQRPWALLLALLLTLGAAELFWRTVESSALRLSRAIGRRGVGPVTRLELVDVTPGR